MTYNDSVRSRYIFGQSTCSTGNGSSCETCIADEGCCELAADEGSDELAEDERRGHRDEGCDEGCDERGDENCGALAADVEEGCGELAADVPGWDELVADVD